MSDLLNKREVVPVLPTAAPQEGLAPAILLVVPKRRLKNMIGQVGMRWFDYCDSLARESR